MVAIEEAGGGRRKTDGRVCTFYMFLHRGTKVQEAQ
jgi:hypothetical protein